MVASPTTRTSHRQGPGDGHHWRPRGSDAGYSISGDRGSVPSSHTVTVAFHRAVMKENFADLSLVKI